VLAKREQKIEEGSPETDAGREDQLMPNGSKHRRTEANIYLIECRTGGEAGGCSGLEGQRTHMAEGTIGRKDGGWRFIGSSLEKREQTIDVECPEKERVWRFEEPDTDKDEGTSNRKNRTNSRRPSHGPGKGIGLDLEATNECLRTDRL
jgi:hypothetical protein